MLYIHERNLQTKIRTNYKNKAGEIQNLYDTVYLPMRAEISSLTFSEENPDAFVRATELFNAYYDFLNSFSETHSISSQSKFASTFLEEISAYLFKDLPDITSNALGVFNKGIYAGLKIDGSRHIEIIKKDVDFCIGKKVTITIDNQQPTTLILPVVAVEVKTYLDATMFGEVKSSSKSIKSASPNSHTYVLMGHKNLADEHIIAARQDSVLNEIFVLRANEHSPMDATTIFDYWKEISAAISELANDDGIHVPGRLLNP